MPRKTKVDAKTLCELYWQKNLNCREIAELFGHKNEGSIRRYFYRYNIPLRTKSVAFKLAENSGRFNKGQEPWNKGLKGVQIPWNKVDLGITEAELRRHYEEEQMSADQIANIYRVSRWIIYNRLKEFGISCRDDKDAAKIRSIKNIEWRKNISGFLKGHRPWNKGKKCYWHSSTEFKKGNRPTSNVFKAMQPEPNKNERILLNIFDNYNLPFKFVGNGALVIDGYCPDFVCITNPTKLIELFGVYWHGKNGSRKKMPYHQTEEGRKELFRRYGYMTLIIWEDELSNVPAVVEKVKDFLKVGI